MKNLACIHIVEINNLNQLWLKVNTCNRCVCLLPSLEPQVRLPHQWSTASHSCFPPTEDTETSDFYYSISTNSFVVCQMYVHLFKAVIYKRITIRSACVWVTTQFALHTPCHSWASLWQWSLPLWISLAKQTDLGPAWRCDPGTQGEWWAALGRLRSDCVTEATGEEETEFKKKKKWNVRSRNYYIKNSLHE